MIRKFVVLVALASTMAFGQMRNNQQSNPTPSAGSPSRTDSGPTNDMQPKPIPQVLHDSPALSAKLKEMLPEDLSPEQACAGFKTVEQCVTAVHLAQNVKVPFPDLKAKTTGKGSVGMQKAIEQMAASANAKDEMKKAKKQASEDMKGINLFG
jgi:hypothetical protein